MYPVDSKYHDDFMPIIIHLRKYMNEAFFKCLKILHQSSPFFLELTFSFHSYLKTVVLNRGREVEFPGMVVEILPTRRHVTMSEDIFDCHNWWQRVLAFQWALEMLLNILQASDQPTNNNHLIQNVNSAEAEKPSPRGIYFYGYKSYSSHYTSPQQNIYVKLVKI